MDEKMEKPKPKRVKYISVRMIQSSGKSMLVEWIDDGILKRGYVPASEYDSKKMKVPESVLQSAVPFGVDWSRADVQIDMEKLDQELKKSGFWTVEDLKRNPQQVNTIIMRTAGLNRQALKEAEK